MLKLITIKIILALLIFTPYLAEGQEASSTTNEGAPVIGLSRDTLFFIKAKLGTSSPAERALNISSRIKRLYNDDFLIIDSLKVLHQESTYDIVYKDLIILSVSESDAGLEAKEPKDLSVEYLQIISNDLIRAREDRGFLTLIGRVSLVIGVISAAWLILWLIARGYIWFLKITESNKNKWLKDLSYKDYTFLSADQELAVIIRLIKLSKWIVYAILFYITLPIIFSIFPFSREWADTLFRLIWSPFRGMLYAIWDYMPHLFTIIVIATVMKYVNKFVKYIFSEIEGGKLTIGGFHSDWAMPTYNIVRFLLIAFTLVLIFPHLPGSDSEIFKGVSVFVGVLVSLGSSSAIGNIVAGLVITYMRPFKIGDRIKIGEITGDVIEKTLLVTRLKTQKNEEITIPNSSILTGNTTNFTTLAKEEGLIIHTTVTIGYDVPWKDVHKALERAANITEFISKDPKPFVLQTGLDDFYVAYQINAYTKEASKQAVIYSELHKNIQETFKKAGIEIMSPHYRAVREGNASTIPSNSD
ncbi:MAG: transmembrane ion channel [Bacteroidetes bacterium 41-46]|nr:MAG: transmembrane ion channel [Bacteroidetes bacterium 41-46]